MQIGLYGDSLTEGRPGVSFYNILSGQFPNDTLYNLGKPGETVISLTNRISNQKQNDVFDISFLWIGVNDIYAKLLKVKANPIASNQKEFQERYKILLEKILKQSKRVIVVSPTIIGENINNEWNKKIYKFRTVISALSQQYENVVYLNLYKEFSSILKNYDTSEYITTNPLRVMWEALFLKNQEKIDRISQKRGLYLTLDGVHLNSKGAKLVADHYAKIIRMTKN
ncbi:SGNH/GDSL hydrolase family protein [Bacillus sp. NPDC094106]|uniref:SGNH/GDSL hydrolase family protein n=1 Tax=Bacillus sp. NPDC094106 TaxID=3363949 RepID=UPI00381F4FB1